MDLSTRKIAIVGGDEREQEIARLAALTGAVVEGFGFPWPEGGIEGVHKAESAMAALRAADYALFPIPGITAEGALFAPEHDQPIIPDQEMLSQMNPGAHIILGWADPKLEAAAAATGVQLIGYEDDRELMLLRGPSIVEGALEVAIRHSDVSLHGAATGVIGHGNIGRLLARTLVLLGARVTVFARNPVQRADAMSAGAEAAPLEELIHRAPQLAMVFSTVPAPLVAGEVLRALPRACVLIDLAAPPGGIDGRGATEHGHRFVWARGMGRRAPVTVGRSQWVGISRRIAQVEAVREA